MQSSVIKSKKQISETEKMTNKVVKKQSRNQKSLLWKQIQEQYPDQNEIKWIGGSVDKFTDFLRKGKQQQIQTVDREQLKKQRKERRQQKRKNTKTKKNNTIPQMDNIIATKQIQDLRIGVQNMVEESIKNLFSMSKQQIKNTINLNNKLEQFITREYEQFNKLPQEQQKDKVYVQQQYNKYRNEITRNKFVFNQFKKQQQQQLKDQIKPQTQKITIDKHPLQNSFGGLVQKIYRNKGIQNIQSFYETFRKIRNDIGAQRMMLQIVLESQDSRKHRGITFQPKDLVSFDSFQNKLTLISSGQFHGSDVIDFEQDNIILNEFAISYKERIRGKSKLNKQDLFITSQFINDDGNCLQHSLSSLNILSDEELNEFHLQQDLNFNEQQMLILLQHKIVFVQSVQDLFGNVKYEKVHDLLDKWVLLSDRHYLYINNNHCEPLTDINIFIDDKENIVDKNGDTIFSYNQLKKFLVRENIFIHIDEFGQKTIQKEIKYQNIYEKGFVDGVHQELIQNGQENLIYSHQIKSKLMIYDTETKYDPLTFKISAITVQYLILDINHKNENKPLDIDQLKSIVHDYKLSGQSLNCGYFTGEDCMKQFVEFVIANSDNTIYHFCAYNGSAFDHFMLFEEFNNYNRVNHKSVSIANNRILQMTIDGRHKIHDLCKIMVAPLKSVCESFKCEFLKQDSKDYFQIIQQNVMDGKQWDQLSENDYQDFINYGMYDVFALGEIYIKMSDIIIKAQKDYYEKFSQGNGEKEQEELKIKQIWEISTIGAFCYGQMDKYSQEGELVGLSYRQFKFIKKAQIAGRTQVYILGKVKGKYVIVDVCSLYPFVMLNRLFPCGKIIEKPDFDKNDDRIGFYECHNIDQSNLTRKIVPLRNQETKELQWDYEGIIESQILDTITMKQLLKYGCSFEVFPSKNNIIFSDLIHGKDLFKTLEVMKLQKQLQDKYKETKNPQYNPVLRELAKLSINSISGKVTEGLHQEQTKFVKSEQQVYELSEQYEDLTIVKDLQNGVLVQYTEDGEKINDEMQRPIYLGNLIYAYARQYMYDTCIHDLNSIAYQDTDSAFISVDDYIKFIYKFPHLQLYQDVKKTLNEQQLKDFIEFYPEIVNKTEKEFGDFEVEKNIDEGVYLQKKCYFTFKDGKYLKGGFKGVNMKRNSYCGKIYDGQELLDIKIDEQPVFKINKDDNISINTTIVKNNPDNQQKLNRILYNLFNDQSHSLYNHLEKFIQNQLIKKTSYILCGTLQKQIKGTKTKESFSLYQQYQIKNIKPQ